VTSGGGGGIPRITRVLFGAFDNNLDVYGAPPLACYSDFTGLFSTDVTRGVTYTINVEDTSNAVAPYNNYHANEIVGVWFDWNHDYLFATNELVLLPATDPPTSLHFSNTVTVPVGAVAGQTRMRVRVNSSTTGPGSPCGSIVSWGEVQDYLVNVVVPTGVCCRGATCNSTVGQAGCTVASGTAGAFFASASSACNAVPLSNTPCCYADYNKIGGLSVQDIFDFLGDWFAGSPYANVGGNGTPGPLSVQNIFDFLSDWFAGGC
jgi:hypothetical protein